MENKKVYREYNKIYLSYEYWFLGFKKKGTRLLAILDWVGSEDLFTKYPDGFSWQLDALEKYYKNLYKTGES